MSASTLNKEENENSSQESDYGVMGSPGFSVGAFLRSPFAKDNILDPSVPDIQVTVFPNVVDPELLKLQRRKHAQDNFDVSRNVKKKLDKESNDDINFDSAASETNFIEILITIALLDPEGHLDIVLDKVSPSLSPPIIQLPSSAKGSYLSTRDLKRIQWGIQAVRGILKESPMNEVVIDELSPGNEPGLSLNNQDITMEEGEVELGLFNWVCIFSFIYL